jgi:hypothetical protein
MLALAGAVRADSGRSRGSGPQEDRSGGRKGPQKDRKSLGVTRLYNRHPSTCCGRQPRQSGAHDDHVEEVALAGRAARSPRRGARRRGGGRKRAGHAGRRRAGEQAAPGQSRLILWRAGLVRGSPRPTLQPAKDDPEWRKRRCHVCETTERPRSTSMPSVRTPPKHTHEHRSPRSPRRGVPGIVQKAALHVLARAGCCRAPSKSALVGHCPKIRSIAVGRAVRAGRTEVGAHCSRAGSSPSLELGFTIIRP